MPNIDWLVLLYAGVFLAGLGVLILGVSASITLRTVRKSAKTLTVCVEDITGIADEGMLLAKDLNETLKKVEKQLEPIMIETNILLQNTNILAEDIQEKSEKLNPLFDSTESLVATVHTLQESVVGMKNNVENFKRGTDEKINNAVAKSKANVEKANGLLNKFLKKHNTKQELELEQIKNIEK